MKRLFRWAFRISAVASLVPLGGCAGSHRMSAGGGAAPATRPLAERDSPSPDLFIVVNHVKGQRRQQFERFLREDLEPATGLAGQGVHYFDIDYTARRRRTLYPLQAEPDGTYTYVFAFIPASPGETPSLERLFLSGRAKTTSQFRYDRVGFCLPASAGVVARGLIV